MLNVDEPQLAIDAMMNRVFQVVLLGDHGTGKRTMISSLCRGSRNVLELRYCCEAWPPLLFHFELNAITALGEEGFSEHDVHAMTRADLALMLFDVTSRASYKNVVSYYRAITRLCPRECVPMLLANKVDVPLLHRKVRGRMITFHRKKNLNCIQTSSTHSYKLLEPFSRFLNSMLPGILLHKSREVALSLLCIRRFCDSSLKCLPKVNSINRVRILLHFTHFYDRML
jgi:GTP-binding nuclear protein Ran